MISHYKIYFVHAAIKPSFLSLLNLLNIVKYYKNKTHSLLVLAQFGKCFLFYPDEKVLRTQKVTYVFSFHIAMIRQSSLREH